MSEELTSNITIKKGQEIFLDNVSLRLNSGEAMVLLGDNVQLKRLFLKIIASQKQNVVLYIEDDNVLSDIMLSVSERYILRTSILFGTFNVTEYLEYKFSHLEMTRACRLKIIKDRLARFGLENVSNTHLKDLTSQQAVILNIASKSITDKKVIIVDCDSFFDTEISRPIIERAIAGLKSLGYSLIISVSMPELADCAGIDRIGIIEDGKVKDLTPPVMHKNNKYKVIPIGIKNKWHNLIMRIRKRAKNHAQKKLSEEMIVPEDNF